MPRQLYGLGSLVKSIGKTAKKIVKSPIGKAALIGLAGFGMPGTSFGGLFGRSATGIFGGAKGLLGGYGFVPSLQNVASNIGLGEFINTGGNRIFEMNKIGGNLLKGAAITLPAVLAAAGVQSEDELGELKQDTEQLKKLLERGYRNLNPNAKEEDVIQFVRDNSADGGRIGYAMGTPEENAMQASGIEGLPLNENPAGVTELDLRETGGFIPPVGVKEKADDIPAMLSNNEFVFTADAVKGMGDGDVDKGAERMYAMMKTLENGGRV